MEDREGSTTIYETESGMDSIVEGKPSKTYIKGYEVGQLGQKFGYAFTEKLNIEIKGGYYTDRRTQVPELKSKIEELFSDLSLGGKMRYIFNHDHVINFSYNFDQYQKKNDYIENGRKEKTYKDILHNIRLDYNTVIAGKHYLTSGLEVNAEKLKHYMFKDTTDNQVENYVLYIQDEYHIGNGLFFTEDNLSIAGGLRMDYHSEYDLHISPKLSLLYRYKIITFRGGYASGFRSPSLKELYAEWDHQSMFMLMGNPDLSPEKSHQYSLSAELNKGAFHASVSGYTNRFRDKIVEEYRTNETGENEYIYINSEKAKTSGVDVITQIRLPFGLNLKGSYAYVNDHTEIDGRNRSNVRPHSMTFRAEYGQDIGKCRLNLSLNGRWMSSVNSWSKDSGTGLFSYKKNPSRDIWKLNIYAKLPRGIALNAGIDNLFNFRDKNVSGDTYSTLYRGMDYIVNLSVNLADMFKL